MSKQMISYVVLAVMLVVVFGLRAMRSRNARVLNLQYLWVIPLIIIVAAGFSIAKDGMPGTVKMAEMAVGLVAGGIGGWWRGKGTRITYDPASGGLMAQQSVIALLILFVIIGARAFIQMGVQTDPGMAQYKWLADGLLLFGVGFFGISRVEMFIRGRRILAEGRAANPQAA
ncbi:MAG TPA: hypothetical protein VGL66_16560 [Caulobacteraceae bacterium]|jgi:hypothetical protein